MGGLVLAYIVEDSVAEPAQGYLSEVKIPCCFALGLEILRGGGKVWWICQVPNAMVD